MGAETDADVRVAWSPRGNSRRRASSFLAGVAACAGPEGNNLVVDVMPNVGASQPWNAGPLAPVTGDLFFVDVSDKQWHYIVKKTYDDQDKKDITVLRANGR